MGDEYPNNDSVWWSRDGLGPCPSCLRATPTGCDCDRGRAWDATDKRSAYDRNDDAIAARQEAARVAGLAADRDKRAADREASMARADAAAKAKAAKAAVDVERDHPGLADGVSYSLGDQEAVRVMKQMRLDADAARRAWSPGADPDAP